jgi:hypothetical protein
MGQTSHSKDTQHCLSLYLCIYLLPILYIPVCIFYLSICLCAYLLWLSAYVFIYLFTCLSIYPSSCVCFFMYLPICTCLCPFVSQSLSGLVICCQHSSAESFLVLGLAGSMNIFFSLMTHRRFTHPSFYPSIYQSTYISTQSIRISHSCRLWTINLISARHVNNQIG